MRLSSFLSHHPDLRHHCAFFDIGTRAIKLLVAPQAIPPATEWTTEHFGSASQLTSLGKKFRHNKALHSHGGDQRLCHFVKEKTQELKNLGISTSHIHIIATAGFRKFPDQKKLLSDFQHRTGLSAKILTQEQEAHLSAAVLRYTIPPQKLPALLIDHGGGSTEVILLEPEKNTYAALPGIGAHTFRHTKEKNLLSLIEKKIEATLNNLTTTSNSSLSLWGLGKEITALSRSKNNFSQHQKFISTSEIIKRKTNLEKQIPNNHRHIAPWISLTTYEKIIRKHQKDGIFVCGFGLRYGAYIDTYHPQQNDQLVSPPLSSV